MKNKILCFALISTMILCLVGCGKSEDVATNEGTIVTEDVTKSDVAAKPEVEEAKEVLFDVAKEYSALEADAARVMVDGVTVADSSFKTLVIDEAVADGTVYLNNVNADELEIYGGGEHSVYVSGGTYGRLTSYKENCHIVVDENASIETLTVPETAKVDVDGKVGNIVVSAAKEDESNADAKSEKVTGNINISKTAKVSEVTVSEKVSTSYNVNSDNDSVKVTNNNTEATQSAKVDAKNDTNAKTNSTNNITANPNRPSDDKLPPKTEQTRKDISYVEIATDPKENAKRPATEWSNSVNVENPYATQEEKATCDHNWVYEYDITQDEYGTKTIRQWHDPLYTTTIEIDPETGEEIHVPNGRLVSEGYWEEIQTWGVIGQTVIAKSYTCSKCGMHTSN